MSGTNSPLMGGRVGDGGCRAPQPHNEPNEGPKGWDAGRAAPSAPSTEPAVHTAQHGSSGAGAEKKSSGRSRRSPSRSSAGAEGGKASVWGRVRAASGSRRSPWGAELRSSPRSAAVQPSLPADSSCVGRLLCGRSAEPRGGCWASQLPVLSGSPSPRAGMRCGIGAERSWDKETCER